MRIISRRALRGLAFKHADCKKQLDIWYDKTKKATWKTPQDVKENYPTASIVGNNRVVFDILGGSYRLIVKVEYEFSVVYIKFIGTHEEYDKIDAATVSL